MKSLVNGTLITPKGIAQFPRLVTPSEKYQILSVNLLLAKEDRETANFIAKIEQISEDCYKAEVDLLKAQRKNTNSIVRKKEIYEDDFDKEGNPTGYIKVKFSIPGYDRDGKVRIIPKVDAKRNSLPNNFEITGGSIIKLSISYWSGYAETQKKAGAKFWIKAVQVLQVSDYKAGSAFEIEEDYEAILPPTTIVDNGGADDESPNF